MALPVIEFRQATSPFAVITSFALTGTGFAGAIPAGTNSTPTKFRIYNNFANATGINDALNFTLAVYDDAIHQGQATTLPVNDFYLGVQVLDYNGVAGYCTPDTNYFYMGGLQKHLVPCNNGTLQGSSGGTNSSYTTMNLVAQVPADAPLGVVNQGLWAEWTASP